MNTPNARTSRARGRMKIAKQIVAEKQEIEDKYHLVYDGGLSNGSLEELIAAQLEPVREALVGMWDNPGHLSPSEMMNKYEAALALFEEA